MPHSGSVGKWQMGKVFGCLFVIGQANVWSRSVSAGSCVFRVIIKPENGRAYQIFFRFLLLLLLLFGVRFFLSCWSESLNYDSICVLSGFSFALHGVRTDICQHDIDYATLNVPNRCKT